MTGFRFEITVAKGRRSSDGDLRFWRVWEIDNHAMRQRKIDSGDSYSATTAVTAAAATVRDFLELHSEASAADLVPAAPEPTPAPNGVDDEIPF